LRRLRLDQRWFEEFAAYWSSVLGGRHLWAVDDFHFLRGVYRIRHQDNQVPDTDDPRTHLLAWQQPELIYQLFQQVMIESQSAQVPVCTAMRSHLKRPLKALLEFGCASAPIVTSYLEFFGPATETTFFVSDIQTLSFHYAAFKFRTRPNVVPTLLQPEHRFALSLDRRVDVICCLQVFEHLQEPRRVVEQLADALQPGGLLVFDYFRGDGAGLDTHQGVEERGAVLDFIGRHFDLADGELSVDRTIMRAIARKR
jgi:SAM-dependent methyltransferase